MPHVPTVRRVGEEGEGVEGHPGGGEGEGVELGDEGLGGKPEGLLPVVVGGNGVRGGVLELCDEGTSL
jgi:hypothetical protein